MLGLPRLADTAHGGSRLSGDAPASAHAAPEPPAAVDVNQPPRRSCRQLARQPLTYSAPAAAPSARQSADGLNLRFFVDVYALAPPIVLFTPQDNLQMGPVPYGGPTHREVIQHLTPKEHSAPPADFSALFRWLPIAEEVDAGAITKSRQANGVRVTDSPVSIRTAPANIGPS